LFIHGAAVYLEVYSPSGFTLPILVGGIILYCFGWPVLRILLFPVLYLFFAIPLPMNWVHATAFRLKIIAVDFSTGLAGVLGTEAREVGSKIVFNGGDHLMVGTPCSGLRSLIALTAMGVLYVVEFTKMNLKGRLILLLLIVPIAMASNILRITLLCMVAGHFGSDAASGWIHDLSGYLIYIVALVLMLAVGRLIGRYSLFFRRASCESTP
jgi:exosortase